MGNPKPSAPERSAVFLSVHVQECWMCVCVSICGCKVGWFAGACLWLQCARKVSVCGSVWVKGGNAWSLRSDTKSKKQLPCSGVCVCVDLVFSL